MSVQTNQYAGFGYYLDYKIAMAALEAKYEEVCVEGLLERYHDSAYKNDIVEFNGLSLVDDAMDGEYVFFGKLVQKTRDGELLNRVVMDPPSTKLKAQVKAGVMEVFGTDFGMTPKTVVFTHYR